MLTKLRKVKCELKYCCQIYQILLVIDQSQSIVVMAGAGLSTASGIPDFRSPNTGIYANLQKYNLPYPEAIFEIDYFR